MPPGRRSGGGRQPAPAGRPAAGAGHGPEWGAGSFSSLHDDLVAGRRMELEALHGLVVRRATEHGVPVPMTEAVYAILKPWSVRNQR